MSVRKRSDRKGTRYLVDWYDENNKRRVKSFRTKEAADKAEREILVRRERGEAPIYTKGKMTVAEAYAKYFETGRWVPKERERVEQIFRRHLLPYFGQKQLAKVTRRDVEEYVTKRLEEQKVLAQPVEQSEEKPDAECKRRVRQGASNTTINKEVMRLRHLYNEAKAWGWIYRNPCDGVKSLPEPPPVPAYLSDDEQARLLEAADAYVPQDARKKGDMTPDLTLGEIMRVAMWTGARLSELLALRACDVDLAEGLILFSQKTKTRKVRPVAIYSALVPILARRIEQTACPTDTLFPPEWTQARVSVAFKRVAKRVGLSHFRFHDLRHHFASRLTMNGAPLQAVQALLGHSTLRMTERYSHLAPAVLAASVQLLGQSRRLPEAQPLALARAA